MLIFKLTRPDLDEKLQVWTGDHTNSKFWVVAVPQWQSNYPATTVNIVSFKLFRRNASRLCESDVRPVCELLIFPDILWLAFLQIMRRTSQRTQSFSTADTNRLVLGSQTGYVLCGGMLQDVVCIVTTGWRVMTTLKFSWFLPPPPPPFLLFKELTDFPEI